LFDEQVPPQPFESSPPEAFAVEDAWGGDI